MSISEQQRFFRSQIAEIRRYLKQFPEENPNAVILRWIEEQASEYRKDWEKQDINYS